MKMASATAGPPRLARASLPLVQAISSGDVDSAAACFARDGCLITPDATAVHGRDRIRPLLAQLIARETQIRIEFSNVVGAGDVVLAQERWKVRSGAAEGLRLEQTLGPTLVLRRIEAEWKLAIAAPWGWGPDGLP
jgi:ketosteroid isomerase-like protein